MRGHLEAALGTSPAPIRRDSGQGGPHIAPTGQTPALSVHTNVPMLGLPPPQWQVVAYWVNLPSCTESVEIAWFNCYDEACFHAMRLAPRMGRVDGGRFLRMIDMVAKFLHLSAH